ncbi:hypothetical protein Q73_12065 [Bacillus coahuilensis m2-6]|uniref:DUF4395 domain-containing protein n=1 Tax=Bacillus coahuilensis p1.1.43 TaxID=1150625 RepID=A0A147K6C9_9BACI|nr:DUF4395 domain-containing protein [Bacillus coahuilensis]KUP05368.1 hypothetical protein Q75_12665 [Bacillus coahuilensis p1.1.43]KUP06110.1 hypothetical protein Q73_12065 [Bacillus coahuilensis m2-6]
MSIPKPLVQTNQLFIVVSVIVGLFLQPLILWLPFLVGIITISTKKNPIMMLGKNFLRKPITAYMLEDRDQQIFNQWIATILIGMTILFSFIGWSTASMVSGLMVVFASTLALAGYCIGCTIRYRYKMWQYHRNVKNAQE